MEINYQFAESINKPLEIDVTSSKSGVYIHRDIKEIERETGSEGETQIYYTYQEAFLSLDEWEAYKNELAAKAITGEENSAAYERYKNKLDPPIEYPTNGFTYKPKWAENIYAGLIEKGKLLPTLFPLTITNTISRGDSIVRKD